jgi:hypothetical protein
MHYPQMKEGSMRTFREKITRLGAIGAATVLGAAGLGVAGLIAATPASAAPVTLNFATYSALTNYGVQQVGANWSASSATVAQGKTFSFVSASSSQTIPTSSGIADINYITGTEQIYPLPVGTSFVSATPAGQGSYQVGASTPVTFTLAATYCTAASAACTATATPTSTFLGATSFPYVEIGLGSTQVPSGAVLTLPSVNVTLTASATGTVNWTNSEFQTVANVNIPPLSVTNYTLPVTGYPTNAPYPYTTTTVQPGLIAPVTLASTNIVGTASVSAVLPNSGPLAGGTTVTIHGTSLGNPTAVTFGGVAALSFKGLTDNSVSAVAPAGTAGAVDVQVTTFVGTSTVSASDSFTYTAGPIVTGVKPNTSTPSGGTSVTITGLQLTGATAVHFGSTAATNVTVNSATSITATAPAGSGVVDVTVTNPSGTSITSSQDRFNYNAGYWLTASDGGIFSYGSAPFAGSAGNLKLNKPVVGMASTPDGNGYWLVATDGGVFSYGDAQFYGSSGNLTLNKPIVGMAATPDGYGYWLVASDGGVFSYGDAQFFGSAGNLTLNKPVVGMVSTPDGGGYWFVASDGGVFSYGDAAFHGSAGNLTLNKPVVGIASAPDGGGYWLAASDGGIFSYGDAVFHGSAGNLKLNKPVVGIASVPDGGGYWFAATDGGVFSYGDATFYGSAGNLTLNKPVVGMAAVS